MRSLQKEKKKKKREPQIIRRGFAMDLIGAWLPPQRSVYGVQSMYSEGYSLFAVFCLFLHFFFLFSLLSSILSTVLYSLYSLSLSLSPSLLYKQSHRKDSAAFRRCVRKTQKGAKVRWIPVRYPGRVIGGRGSTAQAGTMLADNLLLWRVVVRVERVPIE